MLRNRVIDQDFKVSQALCLVVLVLRVSFQVQATPVPAFLMEQSSEVTDPSENTTGTTLSNDLYVIKAVVYEIGILTDADNSTSDSIERQEEVNVSFYDRSHEMSETPILSRSPLPIVFDARNLTS